ncbi:hypothetical protein ALC56_12148, partial [Trachymyrmex septentrionalis]
EKKREKEERASKFRTLSEEKRPRGFPEAGAVVKFEWLVSQRVYYFLAIYLKGLLQSLKLYAGHPSDLVKCTADFDVRYPRQFSRTGFSIAHLCRPVGSVDTPCGQQCAANGSR